MQTNAADIGNCPCLPHPQKDFVLGICNKVLKARKQEGRENASGISESKIKKKQFLPGPIIFNTMTPLTKKRDPVINLREIETKNVCISVPPALKMKRKMIPPSILN